jgi:hypothetical protein
MFFLFYFQLLKSLFLVHFVQIVLVVNFCFRSVMHLVSGLITGTRAQQLY